MPAKLDLTGHKYGRLSVLHPGSDRRKWLCQCDCGGFSDVLTNDLRKGHTKSCGCLHKEGLLKRLTKHGKTRSKEWRVWASILDRCNTKTTTAYKNYGGRGIKICARWMEFENFLADMGTVPDGMTLDRIDVNGDYSPENCRWADWETQINNKQNSVKVELDGRTLTIAQWARELSMPKGTLYSRIRLLGMTPKEAVLKSFAAKQYEDDRSELFGKRIATLYNLKITAEEAAKLLRNA
jgi:hypothetical protein